MFKKTFVATKQKVSSIIDNSTGAVIGVVGTGLMVVQEAAHAVAPTTIAELTTAISFADVGLGVLAVAGLLIAVYVTVKAAKLIIGTVKSM